MAVGGSRRGWWEKREKSFLMYDQYDQYEARCSMIYGILLALNRTFTISSQSTTSRPFAVAPPPLSSHVSSFSPIHLLSLAVDITTYVLSDTLLI